MLSERDEQVLLEAEEHLRKEDDGLVQAFEAFARCGETDRVPDLRDVLHPDDVRELSAAHADASPDSRPVDRYADRYADPPESRLTRLFYRACRASFVVAFVVLLAVFFWVFREGDLQLRLLSVLVMLPVVGLLAVAVIVLDLERGR